MFVVPLIERKRDGGALTPEEWSALVAAYTAGRVPDYQMSALLMAGHLRGLEGAALAALAGAVRASGERLRVGGWGTPRNDQHSPRAAPDTEEDVPVPAIYRCGAAGPATA